MRYMTSGNFLIMFNRTKFDLFIEVWKFSKIGLLQKNAGFGVVFRYKIFQPVVRAGTGWPELLAAFQRVCADRSTTYRLKNLLQSSLGIRQLSWTRSNEHERMGFVLLSAFIVEQYDSWPVGWQNYPVAFRTIPVGYHFIRAHFASHRRNIS